MNDPLELTVLMYHYVHDPVNRAGLQIPGMPIKDFSAQLDELAQKHTIVTWTEVSAAIQGVKSLPKSACLLTFDDGVWDHYVNVFPILRGEGLSGLFFVMARPKDAGLVLGHRIHFLLAKLGVDGLRESFFERLDSAQKHRYLEAEKKYQVKYPPTSLDGKIDLLKAILQRDLSIDADSLLEQLFERHVGAEREIARDYYLNREQIKEMAAGGMHFGGHSQTHPWFDWIQAEQQAAEIRASAQFLRQIELAPWGFAYPYGGLSEHAPGLLRANGFVAAFSTREQVRHADPYLIGRLDGEEVIHDGQSHA